MARQQEAKGARRCSAAFRVGAACPSPQVLLCHLTIAAGGLGHAGTIRVMIFTLGAACTKHGAAWTSNPHGRFSLHIADDTRARRHQFGTGTADFHVCSTCSVAPIVTCVIAGRRYAVVNVNTFDDVARSELVTSPADFEGETPENRLARRRRNWTPEATP